MGQSMGIVRWPPWGEIGRHINVVERSYFA